MSQNHDCCQQPETTKLPIRSIGFPMHGVSIDVDTSAIKPCQCDIATPAKRGLVPEGGRPGQVYSVAEDGSAYDWQSLKEQIERLYDELAVRPKYELCEFYCFRHPRLKPGFQPAHGDLLANAAELYPEAWAYLQSAEGQLLCKTEEEWQAMTTATWATLADGTEIGWNGVGGAPYYALHLDTGSLRLPDLRGMYVEAAGFDSLGVGGTHGDAIRNIEGGIGIDARDDQNYGAFIEADRGSGVTFRAALGPSPRVVSFIASRMVPVAAKNQPRAWGALACVYLGMPK